MSIKTISKRASDKMSKQPHEQDEQKASDGAQSATSGGDAGKGGHQGRRRSRRYDKANPGAAAQGKSEPTARVAGKAESAESAAAPAGESGARAAEGKSEPAAQAGSGAAGKPAGEKGGADKGGSDKASQGQKPASGSGRPATTPPTGGGTSRPTGGGDGNGKGGKAGLAAIVLVILLAIGVVLFGWQAWQKLDAQQARIAELESATGQFASASEQFASAADLADLEQRLEEGESERNAALDSAVDGLQGEFASYRGEVNQTLDRVLDELSSEQETDERDWLHAEAAYLLRLANQRLQLERDVMGAAALLRTADDRLREADNPALVPVRREIASELAALEAVPRVDRTGLWMALDAQQRQIAGQPLSQEIEELAARSGIEEAPSGPWQQQLSRFGQELKDLVTIRHHDAELEALITPEQESYLRQSVRLVIEQSQLALLKEEQELFEASLDKALTLIEGYYDTSASGVQSAVERLRELKGAAIRPELPDISGSQQALATFIERRFESRRGDDA